MRDRQDRSLPVLAAIFLGALVLAGCAREEGPASVLPDDGRASIALKSVALQRAASCEAYRDALADAMLEAIRHDRHTPCLDCEAMADTGLSLDGNGSADIMAPQAPDDVSQTNTQESGVDEADLVKADGQGRLYLAVGDKLVIAQGFPPEQMRELGRLPLGTPASGLYLDEAGQRVVVMANRFGGYPLVGGVEADLMPGPARPAAEMIFVDVSDPARPLVTDRLVVEGQYIGSRRTLDRLHLVSRYSIPLFELLDDDPPLRDLVQRYWQAAEAGAGGEEAALREALRRRIDDALRTAGKDSLLPALGRRAASAAEPLLTCRDIYKPAVTLLHPQLLTVTSVDMDGSGLASTALLTDGSLVYASQESLYVAQTSAGWWWDDEQAAQTAIHRFAIGGGRPRYLASGLIDGHPNDEFSFSEHQGYLRVVSTDWRRDADSGRADSRNHLFVLKDDAAGKLEEVGAVRGYAPGERIFSSRFLGKRGFVVTFRRVDPLFAFDLSDPTAPRLRGELEIPGFSTYIHPVDEHLLLTIGRDGDDNGAIQGVQLQLFDISDLARPLRLHAYSPTPPKGYSWSSAAYDHHAFTYYAPRSLLAIPLSYSSADDFFNGIMAFDVDPVGGFRELARVDHADLAYQAYCSDRGDSGWQAICREDVPRLRWWADPRRSVVMTRGEDTYLYSISDIGIKAISLDAPETVLGSLLLPPQAFPTPFPVIID